MRRAGCAAALLLVLHGSAWGHHAITGVYDASRSVTLDAVVAAFRFVSPHPYLLVDVADAGGRTRQWRLEMDNRFELVAVGFTEATLRPGDRVVVSGSAARDGSSALYLRRLDRRSDGFWYEQVGSSPRTSVGR